MGAANLGLYVATVLIWGSTWFAIELQLGTVAPEVSVVYRFALAAALLFGWLAIRREPLRLPLRDHLWVALLGLCLFGVNYVLTYHSTALLVSGVVSVVFSTITVMNIVNGALLFGRRAGGAVVAGAALGLVGIVLIFWRDLSGVEATGAALLGLLLALGGTLSASFGNMVSVRNQRAGLPVQQANAYGMAYGAALLALSCWMRGVPFAFDPSPAYLGALVYLSVFGSILAFGFYLTLLGRIGPERASYSAVLYPVVALAVSTWLEGYDWTPSAAAGVVLILVGNLVVLAGPRWRGWVTGGRFLHRAG